MEMCLLCVYTLQSPVKDSVSTPHLTNTTMYCTVLVSAP